MVVNRLGQVLLQRRKHWLWDDLWDLSAVSHVLHLEDRDETYGEAAARALEREMGIQGVRVQKLAGFNYYAKHPRGEGCENEYCAVMLARHDGPVKADPDCVYEHRWLGLEDFRAEVEARPETYTPWAALTVATLSEAGRWPPLPYRP